MSKKVRNFFNLYEFFLQCLYRFLRKSSGNTAVSPSKWASTEPRIVCAQCGGLVFMLAALCRAGNTPKYEPNRGAPSRFRLARLGSSMQKCISEHECKSYMQASSSPWSACAQWVSRWEKNVRSTFFRAFPFYFFEGPHYLRQFWATRKCAEK